MEFYTLNQLINQFQITGENHAQLKGYGFGRDFEISASEQERYPLLWVDVTDSNIEGTVMTVSILVKVLDIQKQDRGNEIESLSDTLSIIQDVYAAMSNPVYQDYFIIQYASPLTPIREALTDLDNGWQMQMDFSFQQTRDRCQIPTNGVGPFPPATCHVATILLNGGSFLEVASGGEADILLVNTQDSTITPTTEGSTIILPDETYNVYVDDELVQSGSFPVYGDEDIIINLDPALELEFDGTYPAGITDPTDVSQWNTFFNLPVLGNPFTNATVVGNTARLIGGSNITIKNRLFATGSDIDYPHLLSINDQIECLVTSQSFGLRKCTGMVSCTLRSDFVLATGIFGQCSQLLNYTNPSTTIPDGAFNSCVRLTTVNGSNVTSIGNQCFQSAFINLTSAVFPVCTFVGPQAFSFCTSLTLIDLRSCLNLGGSPINDNVFNGITGKVITLIVPSALMTCNAGGPHASIALLQSNNTVTVIQV